MPVRRERRRIALASDAGVDRLSRTPSRCSTPAAPATSPWALPRPTAVLTTSPRAAPTRRPRPLPTRPAGRPRGKTAACGWSRGRTRALTAMPSTPCRRSPLSLLLSFFSLFRFLSTSPPFLSLSLPLCPSTPCRRSPHTSPAAPFLLSPLPLPVRFASVFSLAVSPFLSLPLFLSTIFLPPYSSFSFAPFPPSSSRSRRVYVLHSAHSAALRSGACGGAVRWRRAALPYGTRIR